MDNPDCGTGCHLWRLRNLPFVGMYLFAEESVPAKLQFKNGAPARVAMLIM
jgi:hypothetical protein